MAAQALFDIEASLDCELDGQALAIHASEGVIIVNVETARTARQLIGHVRRIGKIRASVARLNAALNAASLQLELHVDNLLVASIGSETQSALLRLAGLPNLRVWPLRLLRRSPRR